ncbi:MAG: Rrf2 family transcriptional regulator [Oscillospiraceae bacterium]|nr:Rrf2 family transcriptional regulator [Oscillospiraceae bacterium]
MKISAKSRYALHLMLELAMLEPGVNLSVKSVADARGISEKYLEQIIPVLVRGGFVKSVRGARGGYHLVNDPEDYTVGQILRLVEGGIAPVSCLDDEINQCARCKDCVTLDLWEQVDRAISNVVDHVTLADLVDKQRRIDARCSERTGCSCH